MPDDSVVGTLRRPITDGVFALSAHPLRHVHMTGLVSKLASERTEARRLRILEVGSWSGMSALTWAFALDRFSGGGDLVCVDAWQSYLDTTINDHTVCHAMEAAINSDEIHTVFQHNMTFAPETVSIMTVRATSMEALPKMVPESFDIVFIDGDHAIDGVRTDIRLARPLVRDGGVICGDDLELQLHQFPSAINYAKPGVDQIYAPEIEGYFHPGVTAAVAEAFGPLMAFDGFWVMHKHGDDWQPVDLSDAPKFIPPHLPPAAQIKIKLADMFDEELI